MVDIAVETVVVSEPPVVFSSGRSDDGAGWKLAVTERDGSWVTELDNSLKGAKLVEEEGEPPVLDFQANAFNTDANEVRLVEREVQLYLDDELMFVGPTLQRTANWDSTFDKFKAWGVEWYFGRKLYGAFDQYVHEDSKAFSLDPGIYINAFKFGFTIVAVFRYTVAPGGGGAAQLVWASDDPDDEYTFPDFSPAENGDKVSVPLTDLGGGEHEITVSLEVPPGLNMISITARLVGTGITKVGSVRGYFQRLSSPGYTPNEQESSLQFILASAIVLRNSTDINVGYAEAQPEQGPLYFMINGTNQVDSLLNQGLETGLFQWRVVSTRTTRILTIFRPMLGRDIDPGELTLSTDGRVGNISQYFISEDGTKARSRLTEVGDDGWRATAFLPGVWDNLALEEEEGAPPNTPTQDLYAVAYNKLRVNMGMVRSLKVRLPIAMAKGLKLGDRVYVDINHGSRQVQQVHRVVRREIEVGSPFWFADLTTNPPS